MSKAKSTDEKIAALRQSYTDSFAASFDEQLECCESPIERLFLAALIASGWSSEGGIWPDYVCERVVLTERRSGWFGWGGIILVPQATVRVREERYRIDFAFFCRHCIHHDPKRWIVTRYAVELDGHDFHERTKEQASRDKRRDRRLAADGWVNLRFTGADVYRDPIAIWNEITHIMSLTVDIEES